MEIALIAEATYPHFFGGVSVWCDHLIRGLNGHRFDLYSICDVPDRRLVWDLPDNVGSLTLVPIGVPDRRARRSHSRSERDMFAERFGGFCDALFSEPSEGSQRFLDALEGLRDAVRTVPIAAGLRFEASVATLAATWSRRSLEGRSRGPNEYKLADAVSALSALDPLLRPLEVNVRACDLVHSTANGLAMLVAFAAKWDQGVPIVLTEHGVYLRERYLAARPKDEPRSVSALRMRFFRHLNAAGFLMADVLSPVSAFNGRWEQNTGAPKEKITVVHNGIDPEKFPAVTPPVGPPTISWIGRIDPLKDVETLVEAFALVVEEIPDARLRLFGPVPAGNETYYWQIAGLIERRNLAGRATFEGHAPDPTVAYRAGHVVALSSISEGLPYTLIEAMMSGCPTVSTDVGGVAEVVGDAGMLVPPKDPAAFAAACIELLENPLKRSHFAIAARRRALDRFTIGEFVGAYDALYRSMLDAALGAGDGSSRGVGRVGGQVAGL